MVTGTPYVAYAPDLAHYAGLGLDVVFPARRQRGQVYPWRAVERYSRLG